MRILEDKTIVLGNVIITGAVGVNTTAASTGGALDVRATIVDTDNADGQIITTVSYASVSGENRMFGFSSQATHQNIGVGVVDTGTRTAITGDAMSVLSGFAGTLGSQVGVRGRAGFVLAASGAMVQQAIGGYFEIKNATPGVVIDDAYGVYINNDETVGTIVRRWDIFAASSLAKSYIAGQLGIGVTPSYRVQVSTAVANDRAIDVTNTGTATAAFGVVATVAGAAGVNYGFWASATNAGSGNYAFYAAAGDSGTLWVDTTNGDNILKRV